MFAAWPLLLNFFVQFGPAFRDPRTAAMTLSAGAPKWAASRLRRLMFSAGSGHHTPSVFYLIHTDGGDAGVSFRSGED